MEATMTKAQMKEEAIRKAAEAAAAKKAIEDAKKAAKKAKVCTGGLSEQREKAAEALARKEKERDEREKREAEEAYTRSVEGRAALKAKREEEQMAHKKFMERSERYNLKLGAYYEKHKIVFKPDGSEYTADECAAMWSNMSRSERKKEQSRLYPDAK